MRLGWSAGGSAELQPKDSLLDLLIFIWGCEVVKKVKWIEIYLSPWHPLSPLLRGERLNTSRTIFLSRSSKGPLANSVSDLDSVNPEPGIFLNPDSDPGCT